MPILSPHYIISCYIISYYIILYHIYHHGNDTNNTSTSRLTSSSSIIILRVDSPFTMRYASTTSGAERSVIRLLSAAVAVGFFCSHYVENANRIFITVTSVSLFVKSPYVGLWIIDPIYVYPGYGKETRTYRTCTYRYVYRYRYCTCTAPVQVRVLYASSTVLYLVPLGDNQRNAAYSLLASSERPIIYEDLIYSIPYCI